MTTFNMNDKYNYETVPYITLCATGNGGVAPISSAPEPKTALLTHDGSRPFSCRTSTHAASTPVTKPAVWPSHDTPHSAIHVVGASPQSNPPYSANVKPVQATLSAALSEH